MPHKPGAHLQSTVRVPQSSPQDIPDLGLRSQEGQERTMGRDEPKPRKLLLRRGARGSDPGGGWRQHSQPFRPARRTREVPQTRLPRGRGPSERQEAKRKKIKFPPAWLFPFWGSSARNIWILYVFLLLLN